MKISLKMRIYAALFKLMDGRKKYTFNELTDLLNDNKFYLNKNCEHLGQALSALMISGIICHDYNSNKDNCWKITTLCKLMRAK